MQTLIHCLDNNSLYALLKGIRRFVSNNPSKEELQVLKSAVSDIENEIMSRQF